MLLEKRNSAFLSKVIPAEELEHRSFALKAKGKKIATLNGAFDLLHPGHLKMLYEGAQVSDILLVLLNTDETIRRNKGKGRPVNSLDVRMQLMAALEMVSFVSWFLEETPCTVLEKIRPHVHVNGAEYGPDCIEREVVEKHGGRIHLVSHVHGHSSTNLIERIQS